MTDASKPGALEVICLNDKRNPKDIAGTFYYSVPSWKQGRESVGASAGPAVVNSVIFTMRAFCVHTARTGPSLFTPAVNAVDGSYYRGSGKLSTSYSLCTSPKNMPVGGGMGVRMVGTDGCINCDETNSPCPPKMTCKPGRASQTVAPDMSYATCILD
jgi:hypothetical protein